MESRITRMVDGVEIDLIPWRSEEEQGSERCPQDLDDLNHLG